jgi:4-amino-4-deoxy-L-arabinose transferase-like glycosyltransferase
MQISDAPAFVRGLSLLFGVLTVFLYYRIGKFLNGELTGFAAAALTAFSHAVIMASYIARSYTPFLFFLSLAIYSYLLWRKGRGKWFMAGYGLFGICACVTHYSGIFSFAVIGACEAARLFWEKADWRAQARWLFVNALILASMIAAYLPIYKTGIGPFQSIVRGSVPFRLDALRYPGEAISALLPYWQTARPSLLFCVAIPLLLAARRDKRFRPYLASATFALMLGMGLFFGGLYTLMAARHYLWLLPFLVLSIAWALADLWEWATQKFPYPRIALGVAALIFLAAGLLSYSAQARFADMPDYPISEYPVTEEEWRAATAYLSALDETSLIIARRADAMLLDPPGQNPYSLMWAAAPIVTVMPYYKTRMLFDATRENPSHYRVDLPLHMVEYAEEEGLLEGVDQFVFVNSIWTMTMSTPLADLMLCSMLEKTIITFPTLPSGRPITRNDLSSAPISLMIVPKKVFIDQVLSPSGKARECLQSSLSQ